MSDWCILTCSAGATLRLAESLSEAGYDAWSPQGLEDKRVGPNRTRSSVVIPQMPGYVLARASQLQDLLALSHAPSLNYRIWDTEQQKMITRGHPYFRVFRGGAHRFIPDADVIALRSKERLPRKKLERRDFKPGDKVRTYDGGFAGLTATVLSVSGHWVTVSFPRWDITPKLGSWLLYSAIDESGHVHVCSDQSEQALSARAA